MDLDQVILAQKRGQARGITSICSAHPWVLQAAMQRARQGSAVLLVESTCNQVNQYGGYTGLKPADFVAYIQRLARENDFPAGRLRLGGDHLGPSPWQVEAAEVAMAKAASMVREYVQAGYTKIHLDASMKLGDDDPARPLEAALAAQRAACLARVAEETLQEASRAGSRQAHTLRYVIGTEVPAPGGAHQQEAGAPVTPVESARETIHLMRNAFQRQGIGAAWERVIALVVQPGVEFGDDFVLDYQPQKARRLAEFIRGEANLVYEAHSTDYQTRQGLCDLVRDGFAILKVGPALTFAFREGVFALAHIEDELFPAGERSGILDVLEQAMLRQPGDWQKYYRGTPAEQAFKRKYSLSDRLRYYWPAPGVQAALARLLHNLGKKPIPLGLLSQYAPRQYQAVRSAVISNMPQAILLHYITLVLEDYGTACG